MPLTTAGDESTPLAGADHTALHVFGMPEQFVVPVALKAKKCPCEEPTYNSPPATVGDDEIGPPVPAVHSGEHFLAFVPEQPVVPAALKASSFPPAVPTYTTP